jgi:hypothetical protein
LGTPIFSVPQEKVFANTALERKEKPVRSLTIELSEALGINIRNSFTD